MGDRCSIYINIHGPIETLEALEDVVAVLESDGLHSENFHGDGAIEAELLAGIGAKFAPQFHNFECNYADISTTKTTLQEYGIAYSGGHDAGGDYQAMVFAYYPDSGYYEAVVDGDGASVPLADLKRAMKERRKLDAVRSLIEVADKANGVNMPAFTVSEKVRKYLAGEE